MNAMLTFLRGLRTVLFGMLLCFEAIVLFALFFLGGFLVGWF